MNCCHFYYLRHGTSRRFYRLDHFSSVHTDTRRLASLGRLDDEFVTADSFPCPVSGGPAGCRPGEVTQAALLLSGWAEVVAAAGAAVWVRGSPTPGALGYAGSLFTFCS